MASGLNKSLGLLERRLDMQQRRSSLLCARLPDNQKYYTDETAMEIVNSYSQCLFPGRRSSQAKELPTAFRTQGSTHAQTTTAVVYDSHARITTREGESPERVLLPMRKLTQAQRRELRQLPYFEARIFESIPDYPPQKPSREDYTLRISEPLSLAFDSKFESGNLRKVFKLSETDYQLLLDFDTETQGHTQWFYFSVQNREAGISVRFTILNMNKRASLYQCGLKPLVYSVAKARDFGLGWHRDGFSIAYGPSPWASDSRYSQLSFKYTFRYVEDVVYFAHCYPYTYTDLCRQISQWTSTHSGILRVDSLCQSLGHNNCPVLTITDNVQSYPSWAGELASITKSAAGRKLARTKETKWRKHAEETGHKAKKGVVLMARAHPGESNSSLVLKGAVDFLLSDTKIARLLRKHFVFRVVPMLNPDGVVYGNTRTSLVGADLNRRWKNPSALLHPTLFYVKRMIQVLSEEREITLICDLHGHSIKKKVFMYGCRHPPDHFDKKTNALVHLFPLLLSRRCRWFSYKSCRFDVTCDREATSRVVLFRELGIARSYTLETSFFGPMEDGESHLEQRQFEEIGKELCAGLITFVSRNVFRKKVAEAVRQVRIIKTQKQCIPSVREQLSMKMEEIKFEAESLLLTELEKATDNFGLAEAMEELTPFQDELTQDFSSDDDSEETESSESSGDERKVSGNLSEFQPQREEKPIIHLQVPSRSEKHRLLPSRSISRQRIQRPTTSLSRSQSLFPQNRIDGTQPEACIFTRLKDVSSKYMQFAMNPPHLRPKASLDLTGDESFPLASVAIRGEQLRQREAPEAKVVVARSAGAFRSVLQGRPSSSLSLSSSSLACQSQQLARIQSALYVRKKLLWRADDKKSREKSEGEILRTVE